MTENKKLFIDRKKVKERFEFKMNARGKADIIDWVESKEKNAICIYNDLGIVPFSSAKAVCDKLNEQDKIIKELKQEIKELEEKNNKLKQDNDLDTIFGISDEELTKKFESAINRDKEICKSKGLPIAGYDNKNKCAYLEYSDGKKEYIKDLNSNDFEMTEKHKVLIELENNDCYKCPFLNSSDTGENCRILRKGIQEGEWSNIDFQFDEGWRYKNCPLLHDGYLCRFCGIKVIIND